MTNKNFNEYVVYHRNFIHKKGKMPDIEYVYFVGSLYDYSFTKNIIEAERIFDIKEAKEIADLLGLDVGKISVVRV
ncbi:hypothetical protein IHV10_22165 [Fictibacillus sp. 5RED26]|jgi:hypothetical protein|uniref:hypothetical protein n=1 Tax=Fictibacillus sp. 5RED26 TaxID=2745876 RepID=UPI0018CCE5B1|nr:hypothetical protein [Fictibacillus sp. 5RED26]MBH0159078.1 hypothetical protein [Fictibacillus sp. 5RED26]